MRTRELLVALPVTALVALLLAAGTAGAVRSAPDAPTGTLMIDDFESGTLDPDVWTSVSDLDTPPERFGEYTWALSDCRAAGGTSSLWAVGGGADGAALDCGDRYPHGAASSAVLELDLTGFSQQPQQLELVFDFWLNTRVTPTDGGVVPDGLFVSYLHPGDTGRPERVVGAALTTQYPEAFWPEPWRLDLLSWSDVNDPDRAPFDLLGRVVQLEFLFVSTDDVSASTEVGGAFIDNVRLESDVDIGGGEAPTPSPPPTETLAPAPTLTPGATPTAPPAATATTEPASSEVYLPRLYRDGG